MNILNWLCCRQNQKSPPKKHIVTSFIKNSSQKNPIWLESQGPFNLADKYKGQQLNGLPNGHGQMMYKNGDYYRGQWVNGQKQGRGIQIYNEKSQRYQGQWKANLPNGQGKLTFQDGSYYIGEFKEALRHGKGQFYDFENKKILQQFYENGVLKNQKIKQTGLSNQQQFPTLVLDKQRFNSEDLQNFQRQNPQIKQFQVSFLTKYYSICKIIKLPFIKKHMKQWDDKQVRQFLEAIDLVRCKQIFYKNKIKGKNLLTIDQKQMKQDLKMKLGDRKKLANYCRYLSEIYNQEKKRKQNKKSANVKRVIPQKRVTQRLIMQGRQNKYQKFKTAYVDEEDIIQEQNQLDTQKQSFQRSNSKSKQQNNSKDDNNLHKNYQTQQWVEYYSNQVHSLNQAVMNQIYHQDQIIPKSQKSSSSQSKHSLAGSIVKNISLRKKSKQEVSQDFLTNNLPQKIKLMTSQTYIQRSKNQSESQNQKKNTKQHRNDKNESSPKKNTQKSIPSSSSSSSSSSKDLPDLTRKKTMGNRNFKQGGMQIRQLYQFLKQRGNLQFIIKQRQIEILQLIGEGGYGKVYKGKYMSCPVAVKDYIKTVKHQNQQDFLKQLEILSGLKHPNIVLYMGICITTDKYQLVTQYLQNGSLFDQIHRKKKQFTKDQILQIVDDIVKGMVYLHNMKKILHRDLKSSNVLLDEDWKVKLCDFGLSGHKKKSKKKKHGRIGTYQWMAPQVMKKQQMDFFSDVYSFGVIIWELLTSRIPYEGYTQHQIIGQVGYDENYKLKLDNHDGMWRQDDFIVKLMDECLIRTPSQRPTFIQIQSKLNDYIQKLEQMNDKRQNS